MDTGPARAELFQQAQRIAAILGSHAQDLRSASSEQADFGDANTVAYIDLVARTLERGADVISLESVEPANAREKVYAQNPELLVEQIRLNRQTLTVGAEILASVAHQIRTDDEGSAFTKSLDSVVARLLTTAAALSEADSGSG